MNKYEDQNGKNSSIRYNIKEFIGIVGALASCSGIVILLIGEDTFSSIIMAIVIVFPLTSFSFLILGFMYSLAKDHYQTNYLEKSTLEKCIFISLMIILIPFFFLLIVIAIIQGLIFIL